MATLIKEAKYILSNIGNNNNKFWYIELYDDGSTITRNGRVGASGQIHNKSHGSRYSAESFFDSKCAEKEGKGYRPLNVIGVQGDSRMVRPISNLNEIARKQIKTNNTLVGQLINYFTQVNAHNICSATGGQIVFNNTTGLFSTPLGIVTQANINEANCLLAKIGDKVSTSSYDYELERFTNEYMMFVPQNVGMRRVEVRSFWNNLMAVQRQKQIVDSLEASLIQASQGKLVKDDNGEVPEVFDVQLDLVTEDATIEKVKKLYEGSKNDIHCCSHLKLKKVYSVQIAVAHKEFSNKGMPIGNVKSLWHGTRASNVLSILKQGLVIPPSSSSHCTGRMFGNGVYFSDQSTKALNYSYGYWGGKSTDNNCFMFLCQVALGKPYTPSGGYMSSSFKPPKGYDSTFAKAGKSGVKNNEMIVYETYQANLQYLVEFSS
ncbi:MAG: WGR domain-containing protein [Synergistaceae bacterium]